MRFITERVLFHVFVSHCIVVDDDFMKHNQTGMFADKSGNG